MQHSNGTDTFALPFRSPCYIRQFFEVHAKLCAVELIQLLISCVHFQLFSFSHFSPTCLFRVQNFVLASLFQAPSSDVLHRKDDLSFSVGVCVFARIWFVNRTKSRVRCFLEHLIILQNHNLQWYR